MAQVSKERESQGGRSQGSHGRGIGAGNARGIREGKVLVRGIAEGDAKDPTRSGSAE